MPLTPPAHPPKNQLIAFGQGKLVDAELTLVEQHLEACPECCETLFDLKDDTFVELVKFAKPPHSPKGGFGLASAHEATLLLKSGEPTTADDLPVELQSHPRYRIVELIGRGGMGNVYRAEHRLMNRQVAIKLINAQLVRNSQAVERFRREVQAAAKLSHPNIVGAFDAEQAGNAHFLVMEFVVGTDLASVVKQRGPLPVVLACDCIRQAAAGLQHAHEKGMVHRDIKPHNLMMSADGQVRILDFGLAGFVSDSAAADAVSDSADAGGVGHVGSHLTTFGSMMGTPDYMAPEQATDAHSADIRADIYSLGCALHFLLTGQPPFTTDNALAKLKAHAQQAPPALTDVPTELASIAARMMAKNPADRFQTPTEVIVAIEPLRQASRRRSKVGKVVAAAMLGFLLLLAGVIVVTTDRGRLEIQSDVDDVKVIVKRGGEQVEVFDLKTGSQMRWLPSGEYELQLVGRDNEVKLDKSGFRMSRLGHVIIQANWKADARGVVRAFAPTDKPITTDGVTVDDRGKKVPANENRTARRFKVPVRTNLVTDPSLEETAIDEKYPANWGTGNILPPGGYQHRVVAGGRTGERGWQIEGDGQFAVVPSNRRPANPAFRYAASAWVRVDSGAALIKLLYFDANNRYLGENVGPTVIDHGEWRRLTMIDELARYPEARTLSLALAFTGKGKAVFDDLELLAFDARDLPQNFEIEYGAVAKSTAAVFDRWVGEWETTFDVRPTATTAEKAVRGTMTHRKVLGDHFLLSHSVADDMPPFLMFLGWDKFLAEFRIWIFGGGGEAFERHGRWESASQMLTMQLVPPSPGVTGTSTDRFIGNDRVESTLFVKAANGQVTRDSRWSARRKSPQPDPLPNLPTAAGPASSPEELKLVDKLAGEWTIRATMKPSLSLPNGGEETLIEKNVWVLGGRYLWSRAYNAKGENTSMWIMTYEPNEKSNRVWFFGHDGGTGQWRVSWDANARGFHWRAIDMPPGWIGSGLNRWINDDTWDNQVLIKDEDGRAVIDMTQEKRRKK